MHSFPVAGNTTESASDRALIFPNRRAWFSGGTAPCIVKPSRNVGIAVSLWIMEREILDTRSLQAAIPNVPFQKDPRLPTRHRLSSPRREHTITWRPARVPIYMHHHGPTMTSGHDVHYSVHPRAHRFRSTQIRGMQAHSPPPIHIGSGSSPTHRVWCESSDCLRSNAKGNICRTDAYFGAQCIRLMVF